MGQDDLHQILAGLPRHGFDGVLVDETTSDDAAAVRIEGDRALVQTVDFFTPIVDDPYLFGSIAATNAVSDIYAMGARPILGLAIAGFPTDKLPMEVLGEILRGGAEKAAEAGFPVAGGHTIIDDVPKYGLAVTGVAEVNALVRNSTGRAGDAIYLTKPIGNGILISAFRAHSANRVSRLVGRSGPDIDEAVQWMTLLNRDGADAMIAAAASAATDVTGYGLVGHLVEMARGAGLGFRLRAAAVPVMKGAREWMARGYRPEGSERNAQTLRRHVQLETGEEDWNLLCDAQTSGGLLIATGDPARLERELAARKVFFARIGELTEPGAAMVIQP